MNKIHTNKILYIGSNIHIEPINHFPNTKDFVFIDTQPRSEFDTYHPKFNIHCYRPKFYSNLIKTCQQYGFILKSSYELDSNYYKNILSWKKKFEYFVQGFPEFINPTLLVFINNITNQTINYYISTNIKFNMTPILCSDIESCDGIIISGFYPDIELLKYIKQPICLFGYTNTYYIIEKPNNDFDKQNIIYYLQTFNDNIKYYFKDFFVIVKETGVIYKCTNFDNFKLTIEKHKIIY